MVKFIWNKENQSKKNYFAIALIVYVILSALFILFVMYWFLRWTVFTSWLIQWQQQWYSAAYNEVVEFLNNTCEIVPITAGEITVNTINVICLQESDSQATLGQETE